MTRLEQLQADLAQRMKDKMEAEGLSLPDVAEVLFGKRTLKNKVYRMLHPLVTPAGGKKPYGADWTASDLLLVTGWIGCGLGGLDRQTHSTLGDVLDAIRRLETGTEQQKNIACALLRTYCASTGLGIETQITGSLDAA